ncbi:GNAT family N-acetyltransferase [Bacillus mangrovi]|uniref:GNAT family N-acetyltransferase n=1 Tax=Metabacillus mangrovi TaxID=1491830 RepID=A0A7X2S633_9BACI|nr:GNAT family protein [Metabacillus mangrovi]MTH53935.1 GNAT family N-acetyltransferase [Metabacillus mangrovi]
MRRAGKRIFIRDLEERDAEMLYPIWSDRDVVRYLNMEAAATIEEVRSMIYMLRTLSGKKKAFRYAIADRKTGCIIGTCGFNEWDNENKRGEIGYELGQGYWGKGYMQEALYMMLSHAFQEMKANRIEAKVLPENSSSIRLLEKLQFQKEGLLRKYEKINKNYCDVLMYSLLKEDQPFLAD